MKILVTGSQGFLGKELVKQLKDLNYEVRGVDLKKGSSIRGDLTNYYIANKACKGMDIIIHLAAKSGGIGYYSKYPATVISENNKINSSVFEMAVKHKVKKIIYISSSMAFDSDSAYGFSKLEGEWYCKSFKEEFGLNYTILRPFNLYGAGDFLDPEHSHVIPALIKKFIDAKRRSDEFVPVWGTGKAKREFIHVSDAARAIILALEKYDKPGPINLGASNEISIKDLVTLLKKLTGFKGKIVWDKTKPDGQLRRKLDTTKALKEIGFIPEISFEEGLKDMIEWYSRI